MFVNLSQGISHLFLKMLIELCAFDEAVSETGLLVSQQLVLRKADDAASMAFFHCVRGHFVLELIFKFITKDCEVEASVLSRHFIFRKIKL